MAFDRLQRLLARDVSHRLDGTATAELHQFRGQLFLVDGWARGSGDALSTPDAVELGAAVIRRLSHGRTHGRPLVTTSSAERRERVDWDRFCRRKAHVQPDDYEPERRLRLLWDVEGLRFSPGPPEPVAWRALDADDTASVGRALLEALDRSTPRWPVLGRALIAFVRGRYLIVPMEGMYLRTPVADLPIGSEVDEVGGLALDALRRSEAMADGSVVNRARSFDDELALLGVSRAEFDGALSSNLERNDRGEVLLSHGHTEVSLDAPDAVAIGTAIAMSAGAVAGTHPGLALFGPRTAWIAAKAVSPQQVVDALELVDVVDVETVDGIGRSAGSGVFVFGPVDRWVLAVGTSLLLQPPDVGMTSARLNAAVQYFASHRVVEGHQWTLAVDGHVVRSFRYLGETGEREETGTPTDIELSIGVDAGDFAPGEEDLFAIAAHWSIDPTHVGAESLPMTGRWGQCRHPAGKVT